MAGYNRQPRQDQDQDGAYPESFRCPIGRSLMRDPHTAADGHSYEKAESRGWKTLVRVVD